MDQHGSRERGRAAAERLSAVPGERKPVGSGTAGRDFPALPARQTWRGSNRRGDRKLAIGGVRSGGKPAARAESAVADDTWLGSRRRSSKADAGLRRAACAVAGSRVPARIE